MFSDLFLLTTCGFPAWLMITRALKGLPDHDLNPLISGVLRSLMSAASSS